MSTLILGGTGFIGRRLVPLLAQRGEEVVCVDVNPGTASYGQLGDRVRVVAYGWLTTLATVNDALHMAEKVNAPQLLLWESDYLGLPPENADVIARLTALSASSVRQ